MSITAMNESLHALTKIHEELLKVSQRKTDVIKEGSTDKLQAILAEERKYIKRLEQAEQERQKEVEKWYIDQQLPPGEMTITHILEVLPDKRDQQALEKMTICLTEVLTALKQQEQLNQVLLQQSMQFVQLSLDLLSPTIRNMNYGKNQGTEGEKRSLFDSKA